MAACVESPGAHAACGESPGAHGAQIAGQIAAIIFSPSSRKDGSTQEPRARKVKQALFEVQERVKLIITSADKVDAAVEALRSSQPRVLVGSISQHEWLAPALDVIVTSPGKASYALFELSVIMDQEDIVIDTGMAENVAAELMEASAIDWTSPPLPARASSRLLAFLNKECPGGIEGFGDHSFMRSAYLFARSKMRCLIITVRHMVDVVAFVPSLLRDAARGMRSVVVAPPSRLGFVKRLLEMVAEEMGVEHEIMVEHVTVTAEPCFEWPTRVIMVEADQLGGVVNEVLESCPLKLALESPPPGDLPAPVLHVPPAGPTMEGMPQFYWAVASESLRLEQLCHLLANLGRLRMVAVFCQSSTSVHKVAEFLRRHRFLVSTGAGDSGSPPPYHVVVVSEATRGFQEVVINFDLSFATRDEFVQRLGKDRNTQQRKSVVHLVTPPELALLKALDVPVIAYWQGCL